MDFTRFTYADWLFVLAPYMLWCLMAGGLWRFVLRRRIVRPSARAAVFSLLFAPTLFPIVREAFILGPASVSFLYVAVIALRSRGAGRLVVTGLLAGDLLSLLAVWALYRFGPAVYRRRWRRSSS